jgi:uncharacterized protein (TIGR03067 family)
MRRAVLLLLTAGVLLAADQPPADATKKDLEKLQGDWAAVSYVTSGFKLPDDDAQAYFRTIKGNEYSVSRFDKVLGKGTFTLDATKNPKTIDVVAVLPNGMKAPLVLGIYEFDGDRWKFCVATPGKERPTEFVSKEGSGVTLTVWEREKK